MRDQKSRWKLKTTYYIYTSFVWLCGGHFVLVMVIFSIVLVVEGVMTV